MKCDRKTWQILREPESITFGTAFDTDPSVAGGRVAFQSWLPIEAVWSLPADTNQGRISGNLQKLTNENAEHSFARPSLDGHWLAFSSKRTGTFDIFLRDLRTGPERAVAIGSEDKHLPLVSADGAKIVYSAAAARAAPFGAVYEVPSNGGLSRKICETCGPAISLLVDGKQLLAQRVDGAEITLVDAESGRSTILLKQPPSQVFAPRFSPDGKWIAFMVGRPDSTDIVIPPFNGTAPIPDGDWITIASGRDVGGDAFWSPSGELVYFGQLVMGKPSLRARRLGKDHHPTGAPINVYEFSGRVHPPYIGRFAQASLTAVPGHIIDVMSERISNIWIMDLPK